MAKPNPSNHKLAAKFDRLGKSLTKLPWILQGSVVSIEPSPSAPRAKTRYIWTRKVDVKTETISLSEAQFNAFVKAIEANRTVGKTLAEMRECAQTILLDTLPGVPKRKRRSRS